MLPAHRIVMRVTDSHSCIPSCAVYKHSMERRMRRSEREMAEKVAGDSSFVPGWPLGGLQWEGFASASALRVGSCLLERWGQWRCRGDKLALTEAGKALVTTSSYSGDHGPRVRGSLSVGSLPSSG